MPQPSAPQTSCSTDKGAAHQASDRAEEASDRLKQAGASDGEGMSNDACDEPDANRRYEEAIEEEYAKREGGA